MVEKVGDAEVGHAREPHAVSTNRVQTVRTVPCRRSLESWVDTGSYIRGQVVHLRESLALRGVQKGPADL